MPDSCMPRPPADAFVGKCAAPWFDQTHDHCDLADQVVAAPLVANKSRKSRVAQAAHRPAMEKSGLGRWTMPSINW